MIPDPPSAASPQQPASGNADDDPQSVESTELFKGRKEIVIRHNRDRYVLRITRQGKLILNK